MQAQTATPFRAASAAVGASAASALGYWPQGLLEAFTLRMSSHGHCVSGNMMMGNRGYALQQLAHAHSMDDDGLREMAMALFRHFEQQQSGIAPRLN